MGKWFAVFLLIIAGAWWLGTRHRSWSGAPVAESISAQSTTSGVGRPPGSSASTGSASTVAWQVVSPGVEFRAVRLGDVDARLVALRVRPERVHLVSGDVATAGDWRTRNKAVAAINGGYFDNNNTPLGLRVTQGHELSLLRQADWGVFEIYRKGSRVRARIVHSRDYQASDEPLEAVQCGPRLVVDGKVTDLKPQVARRTGIGITEDGHVVLAICDGSVSFDRWAEIWRSPQGLGCRDALNFDGGGSTQLSLLAPKRTLDIGGLWPVPDALIVK